MKRLVLLAAMAAAAAGCTLPGDDGERAPYYAEVVGGDPWTSLVVEVDHAPGRAPSDEALTHLVSTLRNVTNKDEVRVLMEATLPGDDGKRWSAEDLVALEKSTRSTAHEAPVALLHVLYPAGAFERDGVAGVTISGPVLGPVVVFLDTLRNVTTDLGPLPVPAGAGVATVERATLLHEAGHAMGLVDNGLPQVRDREDIEHPGHSRNPRSVMYWQVESTAGLRDLLLRDASVPDRFDADDLADLRSAGGR